MRAEEPHSEGGAIAVIALMVMSAFVLAVLTTAAVLATSELGMSSTEMRSEKAFYAAEAGLNDALFKLRTTTLPDPYSLTVDSVGVAVNVVPDPANGYNRIITSTATDTMGIVRTLEISARTSTYASDLDYAVHAGAGGFLFENGSSILGDVYSNGSAEPGIASHRGDVIPVPDDPATPQNESALFPGNLTVAGTGHRIAQMEISGTAWADVIAGTNAKETRAGVARYNIVGPANPDKKVYGGPAGGQALCVQGVDVTYSCGSSTCYKCDANAGVPPSNPLPFVDSDIVNWANDVKSAVGAGIPSQHISGGAPVEWGPTKVEGDITFDNNAKLVVHGALWVTGNLIMNNGNEVTLGANALINGTLNVSNVSMLHLDASLGANDGVIIVGDPEHPNSTDGKILVSNGVDVHGSGDPKSALTLLSTNTLIDPALPSIDAANTAVGVIYYSNHGLVRVRSTGDLNAVYAEKIYLDTNAKVTFKPSLQFFTVPNPNPTPIGIVGFWREL